MEILCRLPVKTLTTSKIVCKLWLNLITDPHFLHLHQARAPTEVFFQPYHHDKLSLMKLHLGNFHFHTNLDPYHLELRSVGCYCTRAMETRNFLFARAMENDNFLFANSCNGLLCYYGGSDINRFASVWNPCTGEFIAFPAPTLDEGLSTCCGYRLGFSTKANKFKLLRLMGRRDNRLLPADMVVADVCTIEKSCSWKRLGPCSSHAWFRDYSNKIRDLQAVFLKGALHWVGTDRHSSYIAMFTFDFEDDQFGTLPLPHCLSTTRGNFHQSRDDNLGVLAGCLFIADHRNKGVTIWLMKEYGVQDSWTRLFSLGSTIDKGLKMKYSHCLPITYMDNGDVLMKCTYSKSSTIIVYSQVLKSARVMGSCPTSLRVIACSLSLVRLRNSMLGYDVHVPRMQRIVYRVLDWWVPAEKHCSKAPLTNDELSDAEVEESEGHTSSEASTREPSTDETHVSATGEDRLERITTMMEEVVEELRKEREQRQELEKRFELFEERLQDEHAKVKKLKKKIQKLSNTNKN